ncbi:hypothetical protein ABPG74_004221 [Tetrahymena malaccensis]
MIDRLMDIERFIQYLLKNRKKSLVYFLIVWVLSHKLYMRFQARLRRRFPFYSSSYLDKKTKEYLAKRRDEVLQFKQKHQGDIDQKDIDTVLKAENIRELISKIETNELSCEKIVLVYAQRIADFSFGMSHCADIDLQNALNEAKEKDTKKQEVMDSNQGKLPPLYGIPIAIKDHITAKNFLCTMGLQSRLADQIDGKTFQQDFQKVWEGDVRGADYKRRLSYEEISNQKVLSHIPQCKYGFEDSEMVRVLREMGAIVICMTNTPIFCGHYITNNTVFGYSQNPYQKYRTTGGSSGGSGGIVATRSVPLAIGSDLLGSIRMPSGWCGLYGFNPTSRRVSKSGAQGFELRYDCDVAKSIMPIFGPMGKCVDDLVDCMKGMFGNFNKDKQCVPMKFNEDAFKLNKKLRFGIVKKDVRIGYGSYINNLVEENIALLTKAGHQVVEFDLSEEFWKMEFISRKLFMGSQDKAMMLNELRGEKSIIGIELGIFGQELPSTIKKAGQMLFKLIGEDIIADAVESVQEVDSEEYERLVREREILKKKFYSYWQSLEIDALILPISYAWAPRKHEEWFLSYRFHGCLTNTLELPCGTIPMRYAQAKDEQFTFDFKQKNRILKKLIQMNLQGIQGMPIALQVATLPYEDEKCLNAMKVLEGIHNFHPYSC